MNFLAKFVSENQKDWDRWISLGLLAYRSSKHEVTGFTPSELCQGRELRLPLDLLRGRPLGENAESERGYLSKLKKKLIFIHDVARRRLGLKSQRMKLWYDLRDRRLSFEPGQKVWLYNPRRIVGRAPKLQSNWEGPYEVVRKINEVVYCIRKSKRHRNKIVHLDRLALYQEREPV